MRSILALLVLVTLAACLGQSRPPADPSVNNAPPSGPVRVEAIRFTLDLGDVTVVLFPEAAPKTVDLMRAYAQEHYYDGREFNRVVPGHVIQVVDKAGGATDDARRAPLEPAPTHHFSAGAAGIARAADPNSGGPEIFFMDFATSHLDGNYTVWGQVVEGLDVVHAAARVAAIDETQLGAAPVVSDYLTDRQAIQAPKILSARLAMVDLPAATFSTLPLQVGTNVRVGDHRHSLEYPADVHVGRPSAFTWYIRSSNANNPPPVASDARVRVEGALVPVTAGTVPGIYHWTWTPTHPGDVAATFVQGDRDVATIHVMVPG